MTLELDALLGYDTFALTQRITFMINRYEARAGGEDGPLVAFVEQKRMSLREKITLFTDETRAGVLATVQARQVLDVGATYDVRAADGEDLGRFRKDFGRSLLRSTWHLEPVGVPPLRGQERSSGVAILRRAWRFIPLIDFVPFLWPYHFDFTAGDESVISVDKRFGLRDRYTIRIHDPRLDRRLVLAQAVALDALQSR